MEIGDFRISICSDLDYEDLVADIDYEDECVALITQEEGLNRAIVTIFQKSDLQPWSFSLSAFLEAVNYAKKRLGELKKIENEQDV